MKKTPEQLLVEIFKTTGVKYNKRTLSSDIYSIAVVLGATVEYEVKGCRFCFDKKGNLVGTANDAANSFSLPNHTVCIKEV